MKKKVLILSNHPDYTYNFRREIIYELQNNNYDVAVSSPYGSKIDLLIEKEVSFYENNIDRHSVNPIKELKLFLQFNNIIRNFNPDVILSYTIKPNIYGSLLAKHYKIPIIPNITGLGTATENDGFLSKITDKLYNLSFNKVYRIFFQNESNLNYFKKFKFDTKKFILIPGSGVNTEFFNYIEYPSADIIRFVFISRIMKEKGIDEYLEVARYLKSKYKNVEFHVCGFYDGNYEQVIKQETEKGNIVYHGMVSDIRTILKDIHCTIHPSYYPEGISNVLLESAASGRPIITTNNVGCKEVVENNLTGFIVNKKNTEELINTVETFINIEHKNKIKMGQLGRDKVIKEFNRKIVVDKYIDEINKLFQ